MKSTKPKTIAFNFAIIISVIATFFVVLLMILDNIFEWWFVISYFIFFFLLTYYIFLFVVEKFINKKIRLIYKTIHNFKITKDNIKKGKNFNTDSIEKVNEEVLNWVKDKKEEIEELKNLELYRRDFLGNVSHELKTPITNIQGYILTLLDGGLYDSKVNKEYLIRAEKNITRIIEIIEDLEEISKLESGQLKLKPKKFNIVKLTKSVVELFEDKAKKYKINIVFKELYDRPIFVEADKESIKKVLTNLIDNSLKYGRHNSEGKTKVSFFDMEDNILIEITDNGSGIEEQYLPRLFERFYRTDKARSRDAGGSGLGLSIVKHIIEAHKQTINVRSTVGIGTTFAFTLKKN